MVRNPSTSPFPSGMKIRRYEGSESLSPSRATRYRSLVAAIGYAATWTRPDFKLFQSALAQYANDPKAEHEVMLNQSLKYVRGTISWGIKYKHDSGEEESLCGYVDASFGSCLDTRRSRTGYVWILAGGPVFWKSSLQKSMKPALSTAEAELVALVESLCTGKFLLNLLGELGTKYKANMVKVKEDNQACIKIATNRWSSRRTKALDMRYFWAQWVLEHTYELQLEFVKTKEQVADCLTKLLTWEKAWALFKHMGMVEIFPEEECQGKVTI